MNKKKDIKDDALKSEDIRIDYDHLEVSDIMDQIKKKIDARPKDESDGPASDEKPPPESPLNPSEFEESGPSASKSKKLLLFAVVGLVRAGNYLLHNRPSWAILFQYRKGSGQWKREPGRN